MAGHRILYGKPLESAVPPLIAALGSVDAQRLKLLVEHSVTERLRLSDCLEIVHPRKADDATRLAALRKFRSRVNLAAQSAGPDEGNLGLRFEVDSAKKSKPSARACWFVGHDPSAATVAQLSERATALVDASPVLPPRATRTSGSALAAGKRLVRFFVSYAHDDEKHVDRLLDELDKHFSASAGYQVEMWRDAKILVGEHWHGQIQAAIEACDFGLLLVSPSFLGSTYIGEHELPSFIAGENESARKPVLPVGLVKINFERHNVRGLEHRQLFLDQARFFADVEKEAARRRFAYELFLAVERRLDGYFQPPPATPQSPELPEQILQAQGSLDLPPHFQPTKGQRFRLADSERVDVTAAPNAGSVDAVRELIDWAKDPKGYDFFALLGEYGIGKTTTLRKLTRELLDLRKQDKSVPLPIYVDLRDLSLDPSGPLPTIEQLLDDVVKRAWRSAELGKVSGAELLRLVRQEGALLIADGLDEKLVHLNSARAREFIRVICSALPEAGRAKSEGGGRRRGKLLVSCRSHFFRDIGSQNSMLTLEGREGLRKSDYPALCLLPFTEEQIRSYLRAVLHDEAAGDRAFDLIASIHDLRDLAQRPYLLELISAHTGELEGLRARGETVNTARLYDLVVQSWLRRDDGKHQIDGAHKRRLMEELAAAMWKSGERQWDADRLEEWLDEFFLAQPAIGAAYAHRDRAVLKEDLRTATFVLRPDVEEKHFRFAHSSLQEYFLASYLVRALRERRPKDWVLGETSVETLDFVGQMLSLDPRALLLETLGQVLASEELPAAVLGFRYWMHARERGYPEPKGGVVRLPAAELEGWRIAGASAQARLDLRGADLRGARLSRARLDHVDLRGAQLGGTEFRQAELSDVVLDDADASGVDLSGATLRDGSAHRTKFLGAKTGGLHRLRLAGLEDFPVTTAEPRGSASRTKNGDVWQLRSQGHRHSVRACAFSPDGARILSASDDMALKLWDASSGRELLTLTGHKNPVTACAFSPDGARILSASWDHTLKLWDASSGRELLTLTGHKNPVNTCAFSPDGARILSASRDHTLRLWDASSGRELLTLTGHQNCVSCAFSPDGARILSASWDTLKLWDASSGRELLTLAGHDEPVNACGFSPDGARILSASSDNALKLWDASSGRELLTLTGHKNSVTACAFSPDGARILSASWDHTLKLWDTSSGRELLTLAGHKNRVTACAFSPDGARILSASWDHTLKLWDTSSGRELLTLAGHECLVTACAVSPDGVRLLSASWDRTLKLWDASSGRGLLTLAGHKNRVTACAFSPDGARILSASIDKTLKLWDARSGRELLTLAGHQNLVTACAFSPDGARILSASWDHTLKLWDAGSGRELLTLTGHENWVSACAFSPDGARILSASWDTLRLWDARSGRELLTLTGHKNSVTACAFSPDGARILSASGDHTLKLWDASSGRELLTFAGHKNSVTACAFSPDGARIVSASWDHTLKLWDASSGRELLTLAGHKNRLTACAFSPDGARIFSASDNTLKLWDSSTGTCSRTTQSLPDGHAVFCEPEHEPITASADAWRFLTWRRLDPQTGQIEVLPAEAFGPLPS